MFCDVELWLELISSLLERNGYRGRGLLEGLIQATSLGFITS